MTTTRHEQVAPAHRVAGVLYWLSLLAFLAGAWILIDPFDRRCGEVVQIYLSLAAFEIYIWCVLILARWQFRRSLLSDTARSAAFALALTGTLFFALNELHSAHGPAAHVLSTLAVAAGLVRAGAARRWLEIELPGAMMAFVGLWLFVLAAPAPLVRLCGEDRPMQHLSAYLLCWLVAATLAMHLWLIAWQQRRGFVTPDNPLAKWWVPWVALGGQATLATLQLYAVMYGFYLDWVQWYFSPIVVAAGVVIVCLSAAWGRGHHLAWGVMGLAVLHTATVAWLPVPEGIREPCSYGLGSYLIHPLYPSGSLGCMMLLVGGLLVGQIWLAALAVVPPACLFLYEAGSAVRSWRHARGVGVLVGAFGLLGCGALLQWLEERRKADGVTWLGGHCAGPSGPSANATVPDDASSAGEAASLGESSSNDA